MRTTPESLDDRFRVAVAAIDAGDVDTLERLLVQWPTLVSERLTSPGAWLVGRVGPALADFFREPYLLWFVAEDPVRNGVLPPNIADVARAIIAAARRAPAPTLQEQLDHTLSLVSWSWIARDCGVQVALIDVLVDAGGVTDGNPDKALVNGNVAAAEHLVARGTTLTLSTALCLGRWGDAERLLATASEADRRFALVLSALNGRADAVRRMIATGMDVNTPCANLYSHATPVHHAVASGCLDAVRLLVEAGARLDTTDSAWGGTPIEWAEHYVREGDVSGRHAEILAYLRPVTQGGA